MAHIALGTTLVLYPTDGSTGGTSKIDEFILKTLPIYFIIKSMAREYNFISIVHLKFPKQSIYYLQIYLSFSNIYMYTNP
jgi:hypothetical protein